MAVVTFPEAAPRKYRRAWIVLAILLLMGLLSFVSVEQMRVECRSEPQFLMLNGGGGDLLLNGGGRLRLNPPDQQRCEARGWGVRFELSERAEAILRTLGVRFFYL
jgi:hypothetical protein